MISDMYKSEEACKNCGCKIIYYKNVGPHIGKYCSNCDKWIIWVAKSDVPDDFLDKLKSRKQEEDDFDEPTKMERQFENNCNYYDEEDDLPWY